MTQPIGKAR